MKDTLSVIPDYSSYQYKVKPFTDYSSFSRVSMSLSVVDQSVTNLTMDSCSPRGPHNSKPTSLDSVSIK